MHPLLFPARRLAAALLAVLAASAVVAGAADPAPSPSNTTPPPPPTPAAVTPAQIADFHDYLSHARDESRLPGMAVALVQSGRVLILDGFGVRSTAPGASAPVTPDTRFVLGTATQAFNSLLLARLSDERVFDLDKPARRCWSDFRLSDSQATHDVTLHELLDMTAGIPDYLDHILAPPHSSVADLFASLAQIPVLAQPGVTFTYSNASAAAAGYLGTIAANHLSAPDDTLPAAYAALAKIQLIDPLGLKRATFDPLSASADADQALGHVPAATGKGPWVPAPSTAATDGALTPAEGLRDSARDLAIWLQLELSGGVAADGTRLLSENSVEQRWRPGTVRDPAQYGMGWTRQYYRGLELIVHQGDYDNQAVLLAIVPQYRTALAVLLNGGGKPSAIVLQDILLNLADWLRESSGSSQP